MCIEEARARSGVIGGRRGGCAQDIGLIDMDNMKIQEFVIGYITIHNASHETIKCYYKFIEDHRSEITDIYSGKAID